MRTSHWSAWRPLVAALVGSIAVAAAAQSWTFDGDAEEWRAISVGGTGSWTNIDAILPVAYFGTGGVSGGYIAATDNSGGSALAFEKSVTGDFRTFLKGSLDFSLRCPGSDYTGDSILALVGNGTTVIAELGGIPGEAWTPFSIELVSGSFRYDQPSGGQLPVEAADFSAILGNLTSIRISGEYRYSNDDFPSTYETTGLDSVRFTAIPEPSTYAALVGGAALALVAVRRYRRR